MVCDKEIRIRFELDGWMDEFCSCHIFFTDTDESAQGIGDEIQRSMDKTQIPTRRIMLFPLTRIASISITATSSNYIVTSIASLDAIN